MKNFPKFSPKSSHFPKLAKNLISGISHFPNSQICRLPMCPSRQRFSLLSHVTIFPDLSIRPNLLKLPYFPFSPLSLSLPNHQFSQSPNFPNSAGFQGGPYFLPHILIFPNLPRISKTSRISPSPEPSSLPKCFHASAPTAFRPSATCNDFPQSSEAFQQPNSPYLPKLPNFPNLPSLSEFPEVLISCHAKRFPPIPRLPKSSESPKLLTPRILRGSKRFSIFLPHITIFPNVPNLPIPPNPPCLLIFPIFVESPNFQTIRNSPTSRTPPGSQEIFPTFGNFRIAPNLPVFRIS